MPDRLANPCTAFDGERRLAAGPLIDVALAVKAASAAGIDGPLLAFDDATGALIDLDLRGSRPEIAARLATSGRPKQVRRHPRPKAAAGRALALSPAR